MVGFFYVFCFVFGLFFFFLFFVFLLRFAKTFKDFKQRIQIDKLVWEIFQT